MADVVVTGTIRRSDQSIPRAGRILFALTQWDFANRIFTAEPVEDVLDGSGAFSITLRSTTDLEGTYNYGVTVRYYDEDTKTTANEYLGQIAVAPTGGPFDIVDLLTIPTNTPDVASVAAQAIAAQAATAANAVQVAADLVDAEAAAATATSVAAAMLALGEIPSLLEWSSNPATNASRATANAAAINAAWTAAAAASSYKGKVVRIGGHKLIPINARLIPPAAGNFFHLQEKSAVLAPIYNDTGGFIRPATIGTAIPGLVMENMTIEAAIDSGTGKPFIGNHIVGLYDDSLFVDFDAKRFQGDQGFLVGGSRSRWENPHGECADTVTGTGLFRFVGGSDTVITNLTGKAPDDGAQFVPLNTGGAGWANLAINRCSYIGGNVYSTLARAIAVLTDTAVTSNINDCRIEGMIGRGTSRQMIARGLNGAIRNLFISATFDATNDTAATGSHQAVYIQGDVRDSEFDLKVSNVRRQLLAVSPYTTLLPVRNQIKIVSPQAPAFNYLQDGTTTFPMVDIDDGTQNYLEADLRCTTQDSGIKVDGGDGLRLVSCDIRDIPNGKWGINHNTGTDVKASMTRAYASGTGEAIRVAVGFEAEFAHSWTTLNGDNVLTPAPVGPEYTTGGDISLTGEVYSGNGTAALPAYSFTSDPDTGMYRSGADTLSWSIAGVRNMTLSASTFILPGVTTEAQAIEVGYGRTGDGQSFIDLIGDATYTDFGARFYRAGGANGVTNITHRGTGDLRIITQEAADLEFWTTNSLRATVTAAGEFVTAGPIHAAAGSAATPSIAFSGDPNTGLYSIAADTIGWAVGGVYNMSRSASTLILKGVSTETQGLEIGSGRSGDGLSYVDLIGDATYTDYGVRLSRAGGANGVASLLHRGTGNLNVNAEDAAAIRLLTSNTARVTVESGGNVGIGTGGPTTTLHVSGPIRCASYTVAGVPSAVTVGAGTMIYVSNETGGAVMAFSDGTDWRRVTDRAVIS